MASGTGEPQINLRGIPAEHYDLGEDLLGDISTIYSLIKSKADVRIEAIKKARSNEKNVLPEQYAFDLINIILNCDINSPIGLEIAAVSFRKILEELNAKREFEAVGEYLSTKTINDAKVLKMFKEVLRSVVYPQAVVEA